MRVVALLSVCLARQGQAIWVDLKAANTGYGRTNGKSMPAAFLQPRTLALLSRPATSKPSRPASMTSIVPNISASTAERFVEGNSVAVAPSPTVQSMRAQMKSLDDENELLKLKRDLFQPPGKEVKERHTCNKTLSQGTISVKDVHPRVGDMQHANLKLGIGVLSIVVGGMLLFYTAVKLVLHWHCFVGCGLLKMNIGVLKKPKLQQAASEYHPNAFSFASPTMDNSSCAALQPASTICFSSHVPNRCTDVQMEASGEFDCLSSGPHRQSFPSMKAMGKRSGQNVQGKAPPLRKLTLLRKAYPSACYPLLCNIVADSRRRRLSLEDTFFEFEKRWEALGGKNPPEAPTSCTKLPQSLVLQPNTSRLLLVPGTKSEHLRDGMVVFRGMLPHDVQQWLCDLFFAVGNSDERDGYGCYRRAPSGKFDLNYGHRAQYVDELEEFPPLLRDLQEAIRREVFDASICGDAPASVAIINYYGGRSKGMGWHIDADTDPPNVSPEEAQSSAVVSLSLGFACDFCYRDPASGGRGTGGRGRGATGSREQRLRLESGDVLVFGGRSRGIEHRVDGLHGVQSRPEWLKMPPGRINITFRYW